MSLATDLAMGQPLEHGLRTALIAVRMARAMDLAEDDQVTVFYTGLLHFAGCTAESEIDAQFFGDEIAARPHMLAAMLGSRRELILAVRLMQVAQDADMTSRHGGITLARQVLAERAGSGLDPDLVDVFGSLGDQALDGLDAPSVWDLALLAEPGPRPVVTPERLDACLSAVADFADLKSMWTIGHSRAVAGLAEQAAAVAGLPGPDIALLRQSALVHDIGRVAVPVHVWGTPGPLSRDQREQVRLHAYHSERVLDVSDALRPLARLAGAHGERYDGSGYHRGSRSGELPPSAWLLAAADCYQGMREPRAHRPPLPASRGSGFPGPLACPSASAKYSAWWPAAWPPSRWRGSWASRRRPAITTSRACTAKSGCPLARARRCSRCSTGSSRPGDGQLARSSWPGVAGRHRTFSRLPVLPPAG
jgi:HD-GYP domain-containing protein (c-di-GMP phosphodiesterase class II)